MYPGQQQLQRLVIDQLQKTVQRQAVHHGVRSIMELHSPRRSVAGSQEERVFTQRKVAETSRG